MGELRSKSSLSSSGRHLIELMQQINFGRIEGLQVQTGEPVFDPAPRVIRKLKIGGESGPSPEADRDDFWLKQQAIELFEAIATVGDGEILAIEVKNGLPFTVEIEHHSEVAERERRA
ncbi:MAG TPA: hypothetical protein PKJ41_10740 [Bryobacteraceae bacterium]|nr:hypothetical protein [Bryobacteraceae bacterium]HPT26223.1 hypothetical protein [Bryobacteraceae bacterium]